MIRVVLPYHLRTLAKLPGGEIEVAGATLSQVLSALEDTHPVLRGTVRDTTGKRRAFVRFFACQQDLSHTDPDAPLPQAVQDGTEPLLVVGAMAGG